MYLSQRKALELFWKVIAKVVSLVKETLPSRNKAKNSGYRPTTAGLKHQKSESSIVIPSKGGYNNYQHFTGTPCSKNDSSKKDF